MEGYESFRVGHQTQDVALGVREHVVCRLHMSEQEIVGLRRDLMDLIERLGPAGTECAVEAEANVGEGE